MGPAVSWFPQVFVENESVLGHRAGNGERERERGSDLLYCFWFRFAHFYNLGIYKLPPTCCRYIYIYIYHCLNKFPGLFFFNFFVKSENNQSFEDVDPLEKNPKTVLQLPGFFHIGFFLCQAKSLERWACQGRRDIYIHHFQVSKKSWSLEYDVIYCI